MKLLPLLLFIFSQFYLLSQNLAPNIDWQRVGFDQTFRLPEITVEFDVARSMFGNQLSNNQLLDSIALKNEKGCIIQFNEGEYIFKKQIRLNSNFLLKGQKEDKTILVFDLSNEEDAILVSGKKTKVVAIAVDVLKMGDKQIKTDNSEFKVNDWVLLVDDDIDLVSSSWAKGKTGQICRIDKISDGRIDLADPLRRSYKVGTKIIKIDMKTNVGVQNLTINNLNKTESQTSNIHFYFANNCFVENVQSQNCNYSHLLIEFSSHCAVWNSTFKNAHDYGNGGKGYGVTLQFATSACEVFLNNFNHLRHSILLQAGANGNVISKNKSTDPFWTGVFLPKHSAGDIVLHGNYVYANKIEFNICQNLIIDNSHGYNGPNNLFLENVIEGYGLIMNRKSAINPQYFIRNEITNTKFLKGKFKVKGNGHIDSDNTVRGKLIHGLK